MRIFRFSGALWAHAGFMRLWAAQTVSSTGARITREGLALASVLTIDARPYQLGILAALTLGPSVVVGFFSGGFVDRSRKRAIMIVCDVLRAAVLMTVPLAAWFHLLRMEQLYIVGALMGAASVLFDIADHAFLPHLIAREHLIEGNSKLAATESIAEVGGPALAGALVQLLTAPFAIAVNAGTYLISALFLGAIRQHGEGPDEPHERATMLGDLKQGFDVYARNPLLRPLLIMASLSPLFGGTFSALYTIFAIKTLGLTPALMGITIAVGGIGSLLGTAMSPVMVRRLGIGPTILSGYLVSAFSAWCVPLAFGPLWLKVAMLMTAQLFGDSFAVAAIIPAATLRQSVVPRHLLGRSAALISVASGATAVVGALTGGLLGTLLSPRMALIIGVSGIGLAPTIGLFSPLARLMEIPAAEPKTPPEPLE